MVHTITLEYEKNGSPAQHDSLQNVQPLVLLVTAENGLGVEHVLDNLLVLRENYFFARSAEF